MTAPSGTTTSTSTEGGNQSSGTTPPAGDEFKPITSQDELNRLIGERVKRAKPADYDDLKAKAAKYDAAEEANKTEIQKAADAKAKAEQERDAAKAEALRLRVATKHGISDEDADLFLTGKDEATLTRQAERLAGRADDRKKRSNVVPKEGTGQSGSASSAAPELEEFTEQLFGRAD